MNYLTTHTVKMYGARITLLVCRRITSTVRKLTPQHHLAGALFMRLTLALSASFPKMLPCRRNKSGLGLKQETGWCSAQINNTRGV